MDPESNESPYTVENPKKIEVTDVTLPTCPVCKFELHQVMFMDYGDIRVVYHTGTRCVIGVMPTR